MNWNTEDPINKWQDNFAMQNMGESFREQMLAISCAATAAAAAERFERECFLAIAAPIASKSFQEQFDTMHGASAMAVAMEKFEHER